MIGQQPTRPAFLRARRIRAELVRAYHRAGSFRHGSSYWVSVYRRTVAADTAPTVAAKYDRDHKVGSRDRRCGNSSRSAWLAKPFSWFAMYEGECFG